MKISLNTIKFVNQHYGSAGDPALNGVDDLVEKIGAQLGAVEEVIDVGSKYEGVVIVRIVSCQKHPNADKLSVCAIDDGAITPDVKRDENGYVQVVCGAPNVRAGLLAAWLPPGSTVPDSCGDGKSPFVLSSRDLRGVISNGMLASARELALGDSHDGIMEMGLDSDETAPKPGTAFVDAFHLRGDVVLDIENKMFTHRPDCFGFMGVAREIEGIHGRPYISPAWYAADAAVPAVEADVLPLAVQNELPDLVPRFCAVVLRDVTVKASPQWLQVDLAKVGQRPINNIVDYTNFFMLETGQPLHAYDYDKVKALDGGDKASLVVRHPRAGERIALLNGKTIEPRSEAIMIATEKALIGVGGVMGGADTEVDENTKNIIIEVANFDMYSIRRTAMAHGLFTDAVTRFNKGQSPFQNRAVIAKIVDEIRKFANGKVASELIDDVHLPSDMLARNAVYAPVSVTAEFINARLGSKLSADEMKTLLTNVEFAVDVDDATGSLTVTAPFWRTDIEIPEDIVEEVGRLYGFDRLPLELPCRSIEAAAKHDMTEFKQQVREVLSRAGANEVLTYSFVHGKMLEKAGQDPEQAFKLSNALSPDLQYYRLSLTPSLLDKVHPNLKAGYDEFALFEIGKGHNLMHADDDEGLPSEFEMLDLVYASKGVKSTKQDTVAANPGAAFYQAKVHLEALARAFGLELAYTPIKEAMDYPVTKPYDLQRSAMVSVKSTGEFLGMVGELRTEVLRNFKLPRSTAAFGIGLKELHAASKQATSSYRPLPRFPKIEQDICLKVPDALTYTELYDFVAGRLESSRLENTYHSLSPVDIYQRADDTAHKQITLRLSVASYDRTLRDVEVSALLTQVAEAAKASFDAERV